MEMGSCFACSSLHFYFLSEGNGNGEDNMVDGGKEPGQMWFYHLRPRSLKPCHTSRARIICIKASLAFEGMGEKQAQSGSDLRGFGGLPGTRWGTWGGWRNLPTLSLWGTSFVSVDGSSQGLASHWDASTSYLSHWCLSGLSWFPSILEYPSPDCTGSNRFCSWPAKWSWASHLKVLIN